MFRSAALTLFALFSLAAACLLSGCGADSNLLPAPQAISGISAIFGGVHGGQQPVTGAKVYLYSASASSNGGAAISLLNGLGYVVSDLNGSFSITGDYNCPSGSYVYLLALGGNPGLAAGTNNTELALATGLGPCASLTATSYYNLNELTTVATAYSLAAFASSETKIGAAPAYATGLANAFANIPNLVDITHGLPLATTPGGNGNLPEQTIDSLANSLAACVNSNGVGTPCTTLMSAANVTTASGNPVDTFQAALNIAHNPGVNVSAIYGASVPNAPFQPALMGVPNDWTLTVQYLGAANPNTSRAHTCFDSEAAFTDICQTQGISIDASGNVWISNLNADYNGGNGAVTFEPGNLVKFSPIGVELSPAGGYTTPSLYKPQQIGIAANGNVWVASRANTQGGGNYPDSVQEFSANGAALSGTSGFTGGGLSTPRALAIDAYGNVWAGGTGELSEFTSAGVAVSGGGYTSATVLQSFKMYFDGTGNLWVTSYSGTTYTEYLDEFTPVSHASNLSGIYGGTYTQSIVPGSGTVPSGVAIDASNDIWLSNAFSSQDNGNGFLSEYSNAGGLMSPSGGYTSAGISNPNDVVIDGAGNVFGTDSPLGEISNSGAAISPSSGYQSADPNDCCFSGAIDSSGNLWLTGGIGLYQMIGIATPVVTPVNR